MMTNPRQPYFNGLALEWDYLPAPPDAAVRIRNFVERSNAPGALRVLDVGCGTGVLLPYLLSYCGEANCVVEFDLAEAMLRVNSAKFPGGRIGRVCSDAQTLPFTDECFDLVLCFGVLPHLDEKAVALRQIFRVMRPGGVFCVGHLMSSRELNDFHRSLSGPVAADSLPPADLLAESLRDLGAVDICAEENHDWYFVRAVKAAK